MSDSIFKKIKTRIQLAVDSLINWNNSERILKRGEVAIAELDDNTFELRVGTQDGCKWSAARKIDLSDIETKFANISRSIATSYDSTHPYNKGDIAVVNGKRYKANEDIDAGEFNPEKWTEISIQDSLNVVGQQLIAADTYDTTKSYVTYDLIYKDGDFYRATKNTTGDFDSTAWQKLNTSAFQEISELQKHIVSLCSCLNTRFQNEHAAIIKEIKDSIYAKADEECLVIFEN